MEQGTCRPGEGECSKAGRIRHGWCEKHYQRLRKYGDPDHITRDMNSDAECSIGDCPEPTVARGWCSKHWQRWRKYGDPLGGPAASPMKGGSRPTRFVTVGQRFGRWVVTGPEVRISHISRGAPVKCSCPRGTEKVVSFGDLFGGKSLSCGCLRGELVGQRSQGITGEDHPAFKHGLTNHPLFDTWRKVVRRCENPADKGWRHYGGRGITLFDPWHDPAVFLSWIDEHLGPRPDGMTLDRTDPDGNYEPGNVRWATALTQRHNRSALLH
jgi:hypothetical protein